MRGVTDEQLELLKVENISTHTPHARRDDCQGSQGVIIENFNSHASCEA